MAVYHQSRSIMRFLLLCSTVHLLAAVGADAVPISSFRWCVVSTAETAFCGKVVARLQLLGTMNKTWSCVQGNSSSDCVSRIGGNLADFVSLDGTPIYDAADTQGLIPIVREDLPTGAAYYSVAVMRRNQVSDGFKLSDLRGKASCHTGYRRSAGWTIPLGNLTGAKVIPVINRDPLVANDIESVGAFFTKTCAPGAATTGRVCTGCPSGDPCDTTSQYWDYAGAFKCLVAGLGDVAFTKSSIAIEYSKGGVKADDSWPNLGNSETYALACPQGGYAPVTAFKDCHFAAAPSHAILTRPTLDAADIAEFQGVMVKASTDPVLKTLVFSGDNTDGLIFFSETTGFSALPAGSTAASYLGSFYNDIREFRAIESTPVAGAAVPVASTNLALTAIVIVILSTILQTAHTL